MKQSENIELKERDREKQRLLEEQVSRRRTSMQILLIILFIAVALTIAIGLGIGLGTRCTSITTDAGSVLGLPTKNAYPNKNNKHVSPHKMYKYFAVETDVDQCSEVGRDIIIGEHGSAVDSAIAVLFCIGTVNPAYSGIGGGHFMTIYQAPRGSDKKEMVTINARTTLPGAGHRDFFKNNSSKIGGKAVGVPGELMGMYTAWEKYGRLPWDQLVAPSINLAKQGFKLEGILLKKIKEDEEFIRNHPGFRSLFILPNGGMYNVGDVIKRPKFANTLQTIAMDPLSFYNGSLADVIVSELQEEGGVITKGDLMGHQCQIRLPIIGRLNSLNLTMYSPPPPSSGVILQLILRLLDGFGFDKNSLKDTSTSVETYHKLIESWKFAYAKRSTLGDIDFINIEELLANLTSSTHIDDIRRMIDPSMTKNISYYKPQFEATEDSGTSHFNILAPDGSAVAATASLNFAFGARIIGRKTGIVFNNQMDDFSVPGTVNFFGYPASPSNYPEAGKSPMSSMSPTIMLTEKGEVAYMSGASGGSRIISATSYVALHNLYLGFGLGEATDQPQLHHQLMPNFVRAEENFDKAIIEGLKAKGHKFDKSLPSACGSIRNHCATCGLLPRCPLRCIEAVTDGRKGGGRPLGY